MHLITLQLDARRSLYGGEMMEWLPGRYRTDMPLCRLIWVLGEG